MTMIRAIMLLFLLASLVGPALARGVDSQATIAGPFGEWRGHYLCSQGLTGLTLTVRSSSAIGDNVSALFDFYPLPENPTQSGQFTMVGQWRGDEQRLSLTPEVWINQPEGWEMVGLDLSPSQNFGLLTGIVASQDCGHVFLEREAAGI